MSFQKSYDSHNVSDIVAVKLRQPYYNKRSYSTVVHVFDQTRFIQRKNKKFPKIL